MGRRRTAEPGPGRRAARGGAGRRPAPVSRERALGLVLAAAPVASERIAVEEAVGRVLARDVRAALDMPHFDRSYMDGYAVRARDTAQASPTRPAVLRVRGEVRMGEPAAGRLDAGTAMRIPTGGMLPRGADAVVMVEHTREDVDGRVHVARPATPGQHVMFRGDDVRRGALAYRRGTRLGPADVGALSGLGRSTVVVHRRPRVALIATGDEIVPPDVTPRPGQVRNVNQYALRAAIAAAGGVPIDLGVLPDRRALLVRALRYALPRADAVLISGGSSVGTRDLTPEVVVAQPRARILVHGIRIKPGKPTLIARVGGRVVLGLPGNPTSALVIFHLLGVPLLRVLGGEPRRAAGAGRLTLARLAAPLRSVRGREDWVRVRVTPAGADAPAATPLAGGSGEILSLARADGLVRVPPGTTTLAAGTLVQVRLLW